MKPLDFLKRIFWLQFIFVFCLILSANRAYPSSQVKNQGDTTKVTGKKTRKVMKLQAMSIAKELNLSEENSLKLVEIYRAARKNLKKSLAALPDEADKKKARMASDEVKRAERRNLESEFKEIMDEKQAETAMIILASFNPRYDRYVKILAEMDLNEEKMYSAMKSVNIYITEYQKARNQADADGTRLSADTAKMLKKQLDEGLTAILNEEQLVIWLEASALGKKQESDKPDNKKIER